MVGRGSRPLDSTVPSPPPRIRNSYPSPRTSCHPPRGAVQGSLLGGITPRGTCISWRWSRALEECPLPRARARVDYQGRGAAVAVKTPSGILLSFRHQRCYSYLFELLVSVYVMWGARFRTVPRLRSFLTRIPLISHPGSSKGDECLRGLASWGWASWGWRWPETSQTWALNSRRSTVPARRPRSLPRKPGRGRLQSRGVGEAKRRRYHHAARSSRSKRWSPERVGCWTSRTGGRCSSTQVPARARAGPQARRDGSGAWCGRHARRAGLRRRRRRRRGDALDHGRL